MRWDEPAPIGRAGVACQRSKQKPSLIPSAPHVAASTTPSVRDRWLWTWNAWTAAMAAGREPSPSLTCTSRTFTPLTPALKTMQPCAGVIVVVGSR